MSVKKTPPCAAAHSAAVAGSRKIYIQGSDPSVRVPMREIATGAGPVTLYDTSGPYTDPDAVYDLRKGLPAVRRPWLQSRAVPGP